MYGSLTNRIYEASVINAPAVEVGMGATICMYSDRHAGTIIEVVKNKSATIIKVQRDKATRTDGNGFSESQTYDYAANPNGRITIFKQSAPNTQWVEMRVNENTGRLNKVAGGAGLGIGYRNEHYDFCY